MWKALFVDFHKQLNGKKLMGLNTFSRSLGCPQEAPQAWFYTATAPQRALRRAGAGRAAGGRGSAERAAPSGGRRGERPRARARALTGRGAARPGPAPLQHRAGHGGAFLRGEAALVASNTAACDPASDAVLTRVF